MPVLKRIIEPKDVSRRVVAPNTSNELEFISNSTLAHVVFQLSSLSKHSEDLFGELHRETCCILYRTSQLNERIEHLKLKIVRLNPTVEEVSLHDINMRKPFKSSVMKENQIIGVNTRPHAITEVYRQVEAAPALRILNRYREDGKDSLKFYTDPGYFFELWSLEITKDAENQAKKQKHRKGRAIRPMKEAPPMRPPKIHHDSSKDSNVLQRPDSVDRLQRAHTITPVDQRKSLQPVSSPNKKTIGSLPKVQRGSSQGRYDRASVTSSHQNSPTSASPRHTKGQFVYPNGSFEMKDDRIKDHASPSRQVRQVLPSVDRPSGSPLPPSGSIQQSNRMNPDRTVYWDGSPLPPNATLPLTRAADNQNYSIASQQKPATLDRSFDHDHFALRQRPHDHDSPRNRARDSMDLPPPPLTPPAELPQSYEPMPSPPPIPSPVVDYPPTNCPIPGSPLLPPPPPLYEAEFLLRDEASLGFSSRSGDKYFHSGDGSENAEDDVEVTADGNDTEGDRDHRSDLLSAIKKGIQLRKVEERRLKTVHMQKMPASQGHLDVQSIMEAAFEMRRKALEENYSDDEDDDDDDVNNWSDDN